MNQLPISHDSSSELRFPSAASLRAAHEDLVKRRRAEGDTPEILAEIQSIIEHGCETGRLLDGEDERRASQALLDFWSNALLRLGQDPGDATLHDFDPLLAPELPDEPRPYVGLDAFSERETDRFYGRQRMLQTLVGKLASSRLLVVSGPSGSGKSSLVLAGLIPTLKNGALPGSEGWRYIPRMVPGSDPLANLARLLWTIGGDEETEKDAWIKAQIDQLRRDPGHLARLANENGEAPVIGVIDQFEEVFTLCTNNVTRQAFVANLLNLAKTPDSRHSIILTMRTDFESFIVLLPNLQTEFEDDVVRMTPLNAAELRDAIEQPAALVGLKFETGLVDALLHDILGEPAALPLLQFTLLKLWDSRQRNLITWDAYKRLGGGRLALARTADEFFNSLITEDRVTARHILLRLVRPTEGLEVTSRRERIETLMQAVGASDRVERVVKKFLAARLLRVSEGDVATDTQVEIAHEALIRNWPRLVEWLTEESEYLRKRMRLTNAAEQWDAIGRSTDALLRGSLLMEVKEYRDLSELERTFLAASQEAQDEAIRMKEQSRLLELEQEKRITLLREKARFVELEQAQQTALVEAARAEFEKAAGDRIRRLNRFLGLTVLFLLMTTILFLGASLVATNERNAALTAQSTAVARATSIAKQQGQLATVEVEQTKIASMVSCFETIIDGSFETRAGWTLGTGPIPPLYVTSPVRSGSWAMQLGNMAHSSDIEAYSAVWQTLSIPVNAVSAQLDFWAWTFAEANPGSDRQELSIVVPGGAPSSDTATPIWRELSNSDAFRSYSLPVYSLIGRTFDLVFGVYNDGFGGRSGMVIDDVTLVVCLPITLETSTTVTPTVTPTMTPTMTP